MAYKITLATPPFDYTVIKDYRELVVLTSPLYFEEDTQKTYKIAKFHSQFEGFEIGYSDYQWIFARGTIADTEKLYNLWYSEEWYDAAAGVNHAAGWLDSISIKNADGEIVASITKPMRFVADSLTADEIAQFVAIGATIDGFSSDKSATITYNGKSTALTDGQTAILHCAGKKAVTDIETAFNIAGLILYNNKITKVEENKIATLSSLGKKMLTDVIIKVGLVPLSAGTYVINASFANLTNNSELSANFNFTSNTKNYTSFKVAKTEAEYPNISYNDQDVFNSGSNETSPAWANASYKTIYIAEDVVVPIKFCEWFLSNTTKQENAPYWYWIGPSTSTCALEATTYDGVPIVGYYRRDSGLTELRWDLYGEDDKTRTVAFTRNWQKEKYYYKRAMWILSNNLYDNFQRYGSSFINGKYKCRNIAQALFPWGVVKANITINGIEYNEISGGNIDWEDVDAPNINVSEGLHPIAVRYKDPNEPSGSSSLVRTKYVTEEDILDFGISAQPIPSNLFHIIIDNFIEVFNSVKISENEAKGKTYEIIANSYSIESNGAGGETYTIGG